MKPLFDSLKVFVTLSIFTGIVYPLAIFAFGQMFFSEQANGSLVKEGQTIRGSQLLAQKFESDKYFWPRPSAADYATVASGASNLGPTSQKLKDAIEERRKNLGEGAPAELLMASGSGLDPHVSLEAANFQVDRVARARNLSSTQAAELNKLVETSVEARQWGLLGAPRVNVLRLNLELDKLFPSKG